METRSLPSLFTRTSENKNVEYGLLSFELFAKGRGKETKL